MKYIFDSALPAGSYSITILRADSLTRNVQVQLSHDALWNGVITSSGFNIANANVSPSGVTQCDFTTTSPSTYIMLKPMSDGVEVEGIKLYQER